MSTVIVFPREKSRPAPATRAGVTLFMHIRKTSLIAHLAPRRHAAPQQDRATNR